ncbi:S41 family peptidase [Rhizobium mayense]|uniref:S41 family peptidase n=1 Tax=Rhizobium mayense TaxID=1312184 RepID=UPI00398C2B39
MALLINGGTASACEDFALRFKDGNRGLVLGEPSFGSTGQPYFVRFPEFGMSFRVSTKREYFADGRQFEGVGVTPDVSIPLTRNELRQGTHIQLELAAEMLSTVELQHDNSTHFFISR